MQENTLILSPLKNENLLKTALSFPTHGTLTLSKGKLLYLDIDDRYINRLCPLLQNNKVDKPDYFSMGMGAHISVIYPNEISNPIFEPRQKVSFQVGDLLQAKTPKAIYYILTVQSPELLQIRSMNNLGNTLSLNGLLVDLHITIGKFELYRLEA